LREEPEKGNQLRPQANKAGKPFRVRYELTGADSYVADALVRLPDGTVQALSYDSDATGGAVGHERNVVEITVWTAEPIGSGVLAKRCRRDIIGEYCGYSCQIGVVIDRLKVVGALRADVAQFADRRRSQLPCEINM
jgi:hypothetical protein